LGEHNYKTSRTSCYKYIEDFKNDIVPNKKKGRKPALSRGKN